MKSLVLLAGWLVVTATGFAQSTNRALASASRVVLVRDASAMPATVADAGKVRAMVATGIKALTGMDDLAAAWRKFVQPDDVVGIKVTAAAAPAQATRVAVVDAIAEGLVAAGVPATNIVVFDRDAGKLAEAGFVEKPGGYRVVGFAPGGWDETKYIEGNPVGRLIWGDLQFGIEGNELSSRSHFPAVLTQRCTKLINAPVLQDSETCGLAGCLYNLSLGVLDNHRRFEMTGEFGDPVIANVIRVPLLRDKLVLNVMDALVAGYAGGPAFKPYYAWNAGALYFSRDPVAIDSLCFQQIEAHRREAKLPSIKERAVHIMRSTLLGVGLSSSNQIELIEAKP